ncbi:hypothetical protein ACLB2K_040344 [Fragaria x ananassa]
MAVLDPAGHLLARWLASLLLGLTPPDGPVAHGIKRTAMDMLLMELTELPLGGMSLGRYQPLSCLKESFPAQGAVTDIGLGPSCTRMGTLGWDRRSWLRGSLTALSFWAHLNNGSVRLTRDLVAPNFGAGIVLYSKPVRFKQPSTPFLTSFSTFFSFSVSNLNPSTIGYGLAFIISLDDEIIRDAGGFMGLMRVDDWGSGSGCHNWG